MALKTFNLDEEVYKEFSNHCKDNGISMSKKVENFIKEELAKLRGSLEIEKPPKIKMPKSPLPQIDPETHSFSKYC